MKLSIDYSVLSTSTRSSQDLKQAQQFLPDQEHQRFLSPRLILGLQKIHLFLFILTQLIILTLVSAFSYHLGQHSISLEKCGIKLSTWSPALNAVSYHKETFHGKFLAPSMYRGEPRPELEKAWKKVANDGLRSIRIPKEDLFRLNKTVSKDIVGFGKEQEVEVHDAEGFLEVFHQLHCLVSKKGGGGKN
jgi:hypothetical protein